MTKTPITKIQALEAQLEAAIYLLLREFRPEPIHTLIGACRGLLYGLHQHTPNPLLARWDQSIGRRVVPGAEKEWRRYQNRVANFLKHADRDAIEVIEDVDLESLNELELMVCILAYWQLDRPPSILILIGFFYCGLLNEYWLKLDDIFAEAGVPNERLDFYRRMTLRERRQLMLDAFEQSCAQSN